MPLCCIPLRALQRMRGRRAMGFIQLDWAQKLSSGKAHDEGARAEGRPMQRRLCCQVKMFCHI